MRGFPRPTVAVIDLDACARNLGRIRERVGGRGIWAVVKADAYGHGAVAVARRLVAGGVAGLSVATVGEAIELRHAGVAAPLLVMAGLQPLSRDGALACAELGIAVAVWDVETARQLEAVTVDRYRGNATLLEEQRPVAVHLKVDTGMGRLGVALGSAVEVARGISAAVGVSLDGLFSNLAASDHPPGSPGWELTERQAERFGAVCDELDAVGLLPPHRHLANSMAVLQHPETWRPDWCTGVRPGLALYGASLSGGGGGARRHPGAARTDPGTGGAASRARDGAGPVASSGPGHGHVGGDLEPVMSLLTGVAAVRRVPSGWPLGYGLGRLAGRDSTIAVLPVGYHDGWPRALSDRADVLVEGRRAPVVGAISMDLTLVDVTDLAGVAVGDRVLLFGRDESGAAIGVEEVSERAGSTPHELLSRVGPRVPRRYTGGPEPAPEVADRPAATGSSDTDRSR